MSLAAGGLKSAPAAPDRRDRLAATRDRSVGSLTPLLEDVASPARLQGGHETRAKGAMDAGHARAELVRAHEALAQERGLFLRAEGPETLPMGSSRRAGGARRVRVWLRRRPAETELRERKLPRLAPSRHETAVAARRGLRGRR